MVDLLVGETFAWNNSYSMYNNLVLCRFKAVASGTMNSFVVHTVSPATGAYIGLYADSGGEPGALLVQCNGALLNGKDTTLSCSDTSITKDTYYWIGGVNNTNGANILRYSLGTGATRIKSYTYGSLPNPAGSGYTSSTFPIHVAGYGTLSPTGGLSIVGKGLCSGSPLFTIAI